MFTVAAQVSIDPAQLTSMGIVGTLVEYFRYGQGLDIYDYTASTPGTVRVGEIIFMSADSSTTQQDGTHNFRPVRVHAKVVQFP